VKGTRHGSVPEMVEQRVAYRTWDTAGWIAIAGVAVALAWLAFRLHVVGDYSTESDFYGGYADGARLIQHGRLDPARYSVVGPVYELALALAGLAFRDLFTAARWISVASAVATLLLWRALLLRGVGAAAAFWTVAFLGVNASFLRYGYSATTDMLAIALQAATLESVLASDRKRSPLRSGILAALATLTRYNSAVLVPVALACYAALAPSTVMSRRRAVALHVAGFALVAAPWVAYSLAHGHVPGGTLFTGFGRYYAVSDPSRNAQDQLPSYAESLATARSSGDHGAAWILQILRNVPDHIRHDATELLGLPVALLCMAGLVLACRDGRWRRLLPVWVLGALLFATLAPVFYSHRYSLALVPAYLTLAGAALSSPGTAPRVPATYIQWLVGLAVLIGSIWRGVPYHHAVFHNQPVEVIAAGRALGRDSRPQDRVVSRKGHVGYYAGRAIVPFPRLSTLAELGDYCRSQDARYLYYSWYEAQIRPEFAYLLDTTAVVPGLAVLFRSEKNPGVVYRVDSDFGTPPDWFGRRDQVDLHLARAHVQYLSPSEAAASHVLLAGAALERDEAGIALDHLDRAALGGPLSQSGWRLRGDALQKLGRLGEAIRAYERAVVIDRADTLARIGLGWAQLRNGNAALAAAVWRQAIGPRVDTFTLEEMARTFDARGDRAAAAIARAELARRR
jgi:hypothetical protein